MKRLFRKKHIAYLSGFVGNWNMDIFVGQINMCKTDTVRNAENRYPENIPNGQSSR